MEKLLFSTDTDSGTISVLKIDGNLPEVVATIEVGNGPRGAVKFTGDGRGFVANNAGNTLSEIDPEDFVEVRRIKVGAGPIGIGIVPGSRFLITSNSGDDTVSVVDLRKNAEVATVAVGREPRHPSVSADGRFAYIPLSRDHCIVKLDLGGLASGKLDAGRIAEVARIETGEDTFPYSAGLSPDGRHLIAANNQRNFVSLICTETDKVVAQIPVGAKGARGSAYTADSGTAFVSLENSSEIVIIDLESREVSRRIASGGGPRGMAFDVDNDTLFAAGFWRAKAEHPGNTISVLRFGGGSGARLAAQPPSFASVPVGAGPCSVSILRR